MRKSALQWLAPVLLGSALFSTSAAADGNVTYEVTVTNITKGMVFTPILVATTRSGATFFEAGSPASAELEELAESGNTAPLQDSLDALDVSDSSFLPFLEPGQSVTQTVATQGQYKNITLAAMAIPSNDVFIALNGVPGPRGNKTLTYNLPAYDAGTEINDELCASLPGPTCDEDAGPPSDGEGAVYISSGIRGVGDLAADDFDWRNPVARVVIRRVPGED